MLGSKYRGGFSLLGPLWNDGIQLSTWRRANALAHDDGMFTSVDLHLMGMGMYVCMYVWELMILTHDDDDDVCMYVTGVTYVGYT